MINDLKYEIHIHLVNDVNMEIVLIDFFYKDKIALKILSMKILIVIYDTDIIYLLDIKICL